MVMNIKRGLTISVLILVAILWVTDQKNQKKHEESSQVNGERVVITVDDEPITLDELLALEAMYSFELQKDKNVTFDDYIQSLLDLGVELKTEQILFKKSGLIETINYKSFLYDLREENKQRQIKTQQGQVVYGPKVFDEKMFYMYRKNQLQAKYLRQLSDTKKLYRDDHIVDFYEENKERLFSRADHIKVVKLMVPYGKNHKRYPLKEEAYERMVIMEEKVSKGEDFSKFMKILGKEFGYEHHALEEVFNESTYSYNLRYQSPIFLEATKLKIGDVSSIIDAGSYYVIVKCVEKIEGGYKPLSEVKSKIADYLTKQRYYKFTSDFKKTLTITMDHEAVEALKQYLEVKGSYIQ